MGFPYLETIQISNGYYLNAANDPIAGANVSPDGFAAYPGMLGKIWMGNHAGALLHSDPAVGTLFGGAYQYVKAATALARGQIVRWDVLANNGLADYEVSSTLAAANEGFIAGIALNTVTLGNFCWIQVDGLASVLFRAAITAAALGNNVFQLTTTNTADAIADATAVINGGASGLKNWIGVAYQLPVNGTITQVMLKNIYHNF